MRIAILKKAFWGAYIVDMCISTFDNFNTKLPTDTNLDPWI